MKKTEKIGDAKKMSEPIKTCWAAIRLVDGHEWLDTETISFSTEDVIRKSDRITANIPKWAKDNPIVRISQIEIYEKA